MATPRDLVLFKQKYEVKSHSACDEFLEFRVKMSVMHKTN